MELHPVERTRYEAGDIDGGARARHGVDGEQLVENSVVDYQSGTVSRGRDAIQIESSRRERRRRAAERNSHPPAQPPARSDRYLVEVGNVAVGEVRSMGGENHVINERFPVGAELVLSDESPGAES